MNEELRNEVLQKLQERNRRAKEPFDFDNLILSHKRLLENADSNRIKNLQLRVEVERLRQENEDLQVKLEAGGGGGVKGEKTTALEEKVNKLKEELLEMHRKKGDNAQQVLDVKNTLQEKEKELQEKAKRIQDLETLVQSLEKTKSTMEQDLSTQSTINETLMDEQNALQLAFTSLEGKFREGQEEYNELVSRWMEYKARDADRLNELNDRFVKDRKAKLKDQLAEAAKEPVSIDLPGDEEFKGRAVCYNVIIPNHAVCKFDAHEGEVHAVKWSPSGSTLATGGADRKLKLWKVHNGQCISKGMLTGSNASIMSIDFDEEENHVIAASNDFACRVWTIPDNRLRHTFTGHSGKVLSAKFLGDKNKVVSGSHDRTLKIWDLRSKACIRTVFAGSSCNDLVTSDVQATNIISGHFDRRIRFWDTRSESTAKEIALNGRVTSLDLSPDKQTLLSCTRDDSIKIVDLRMNRVSKTLRADGFHVGFDWSRAVFSPDGTYVMAGSQNGDLFIWNVAKESVEKELKEHVNGIIACAWHPEGNMLVSCDRQRKAILWADF